MAEMRDIIAKVMAAEAEAREVVQTAEQTADKLVRETRTKAAEERTADRQEVLATASRIIAEAATAAAAERDKLLATATAQMQREVALDRDSQNAAVEFTLNILTESA